MHKFNFDFLTENSLFFSCTYISKTGKIPYLVTYFVEKKYASHVAIS